MRKTERVTIAAPNRDNGKVFIITEMGSLSALNWCARAMLALSQSGIDVQAGAMTKAAEGGAETIAALGMQMFALIPERVALPLMAEARQCITYQPPMQQIAVQPIYDGDMCQIEEVGTWATLLQRTFALHLGFSQADSPPITE